MGWSESPHDSSCFICGGRNLAGSILSDEEEKQVGGGKAARGHLNTKCADFHLTFYVLVPSPHPHRHLESLDPSLEGAVTSPVKRERGFRQPWLRFPLSDLPCQFLLLPSLPRFVSSPSSLYGLILFKGNSFHAIFREGFKGSRWALELSPFNWKPRSLSFCLPSNALFFFLAVY